MRLSLRSVFFGFMVVSVGISFLLSKNGFQGFICNRPVWVLFEGSIAEHSGMVRVIHREHAVALRVFEFSKSLEFSKVAVGDDVLMVSKSKPCILILFSEENDFLLSTSAGCFTGDKNDWARVRRDMPIPNRRICDLIDRQVLE